MHEKITQITCPECGNAELDSIRIVTDTFCWRGIVGIVDGVLHVEQQRHLDVDLPQNKRELYFECRARPEGTLCGNSWPVPDFIKNAIEWVGTDEPSVKISPVDPATGRLKVLVDAKEAVREVTSHKVVGRMSSSEWNAQNLPRPSGLDALRSALRDPAFVTSKKPKEICQAPNCTRVVVYASHGICHDCGLLLSEIFSIGSYWRFLPCGDPKIDEVVVQVTGFGSFIQWGDGTNTRPRDALRMIPVRACDACGDPCSKIVIIVEDGCEVCSKACEEKALKVKNRLAAKTASFNDVHARSGRLDASKPKLALTSAQRNALLDAAFEPKTVPDYSKKDAEVTKTLFEAPCECEGPGCIVPGVLFPWNSDANIAGIEACGVCGRFSCDDDAAIALVAKLNSRPDYAMCWAHSGRHLVLSGHSRCLTFEEGEAVQRHVLGVICHEYYDTAGVPWQMHMMPGQSRVDVLHKKGGHEWEMAGTLGVDATADNIMDDSPVMPRCLEELARSVLCVLSQPNLKRIECGDWLVWLDTNKARLVVAERSTRFGWRFHGESRAESRNLPSTLRDVYRGELRKEIERSLDAV